MQCVVGSITLLSVWELVLPRMWQEAMSSLRASTVEASTQSQSLSAVVSKWIKMCSNTSTNVCLGEDTSIGDSRSGHLVLRLHSSLGADSAAFQHQDPLWFSSQLHRCSLTSLLHRVLHIMSFAMVCRSVSMPHISSCIQLPDKSSSTHDFHIPLGSSPTPPASPTAFHFIVFHVVYCSLSSSYHFPARGSFLITLSLITPFYRKINPTRDFLLVSNGS